MLFLERAGEVHTNDVHLDPDMAGSAYIRLNPLQPLMGYYVVQHLYFFVLLALYGFAVVYQSLGERRKHLNTFIASST